MTIGEREIMQWHPKKNGELPALPVPFDEYELAAFFLFGGGVFLREADPRLIGENAGTAREALIRARWWCRKALRRGFACNSKGMHEAANWILGQPRVVEPVLPSYEAPSDALATVPMVSVTIARMESKEDRQDRRLKACIDAGLVMPESAHGRLPYGVGKVAAAEGVTRQTFSDDVKAALKRHYARQREGVTHHRIK